MTRSSHGLPGGKGWWLLLGLSLACRAAPGPVVPAARVRPGIEVLLGDSLRLVDGKTVGLVTNQAGIDAAGVSDVDRLRAAGVQLMALFSPEHGFRGAADPGATVASTIDSATGLPIYSLYGATRAPTDSMLAGIEVILVDLPDVGARYYTYLGTTIEVMRAAARTRRTVVVLDRPNPIGGVAQGNVLDPAFRSFVGALAMPMRPGLTLGELARLANQELELGADLRVVPADGWRRSQTLWDTGLPFLPPSPNLKDLESLFHYPGSCLFEGTALSVGRGTDAAFRQIGAPWLDAARVIAELPLARLHGVRFVPIHFTPVQPGDGKYPGVRLAGIRLMLTEERRYDPTLTAIVLLATIQRLHSDSLGFRAAHFDRLAGGSTLREAILAGHDPFAVAAEWKPALAAWLTRRQPALLYR
ncbi:MAG TPA: DUF1343 domain-containing protein [Gemmatimonadales bacterium]|jgi:uncharacterized protein YbbC (DUF1343 family)|nr:DUF1343 domain-containing protein [Gemmatimonadales bacterium]